MGNEQTKVDVLAVLDGSIEGMEQSLHVARGQQRNDLIAGIEQMRETRAAVAEMIAKDACDDTAMVERLAKWMCRHDIGESASLDEVLWRMDKWTRYVHEAKSALAAARGHAA